MFAYDYPILGVFWTMLIVLPLDRLDVAAVPRIFDIFRNKDTGGFAKAMWPLFVILVPVPRRAGVPDRPGR